MKKKALIPIVGCLAVALAFAVSQSASVSPINNAETAGNVRVYKNGEIVAEQENVLMDGEEAIEHMMRSSDTWIYDTIALGNGATPADADSTLDSEIADCGLSAKSGNFVDNGEGSWNLSVTFTSTCDNKIVNTTAQLSTSASTGYDYFAGTGFGRDIDLYTDDQLTVEWSNTADDA